MESLMATNILIYILRRYFANKLIFFYRYWRSEHTIVIHKPSTHMNNDTRPLGKRELPLTGIVSYIDYCVDGIT